MDARALAWVAERGGEAVGRPLTEDGVRYLRVRCGAGHEWRVRVGHLAYSHSWCPECYGNKPLTIEAMQALAAGRGGQCLSVEYRGLTKHLSWRCAYDHEWEATPGNVKNHGSWCPHCRVNIGEELVRASLEGAFPGRVFERTRQEPWMEGLELDGYNPELRLAFEYQGKQHYERVEHFQREEGAFEAQLERDARTAEQCHDEFVTLLVVPFTVQFTKIRQHIRRELEALAYDLGPAVGTDSEFYDAVRARGPSTERQHARMVEIIQRKGGECLSAQYLGYRIPMRIRCQAGHEFSATPEAIDQPASRGPRFCPECGGTRRREDAELQAKVESCGFAFLGVESRAGEGRTRRYIGVRCPEGHEYEVSWDNFCPKAGVPKKGCSVCFHAKLGASKRGDIRRWCAQHGIEPAEGYKSAAVNHRWTCAKGHSFTAKLTVLRQKKVPCTECDLAEFAASHSLELQTRWTEQSGPTTPLTWKCALCAAVFTASRMALGRKKTLCPAGCGQ